MPACFVRLAAGRIPSKRSTGSWSSGRRGQDNSLESWADRVDAGLDACLARLRDQYRDIAILLSGGVDSSLLAAKAARSGFRTCVALTARWPGDNPELEAAASVARHVGIEHRIIDIEESYIEKSFPWITWRLEEPPRHFNSFVLAKLFERCQRTIRHVAKWPCGRCTLRTARNHRAWRLPAQAIAIEVRAETSEGRIWPHCWDIPRDSALPT